MPPTQLVLARAVVGECGWTLPDCEAGVWHTLQRRWQEVATRRVGRGQRAYSLRFMFLAYCSIFKGPHVGRAKCIRTLPDHTGIPRGWPQSARWDRHEPHWHRVYLRAGLFLRAKVTDPCDGKPVHTGGRMDRARMNPSKWREVDCGNTGDGIHRQFFWEPNTIIDN